MYLYTNIRKPVCMCVCVLYFISLLSLDYFYVACTPCPGFDPKDRKWDPERLLLGAASMGPQNRRVLFQFVVVGYVVSPITYQTIGVMGSDFDVFFG